MGYFRFRKVLNMFRGLRLNLSKSGFSVSLGPRGWKYTVGPKGTRTTVGLPGSGLFYTDYHAYDKSDGAENSRSERKLPDSTGLEAYKADTILAVEEARAKDKANGTTDNLLTGDNLAKIIGAFKRQITNLGNMVQMKAPFEDILTTLDKLSFITQLTVIERLQALDFVGIHTAGGFNTKEDVVNMFTTLAETFDSIGNMIKAGITNGVPDSKIYSAMRISKLKKIMRVVEKEFATAELKIDWAEDTK
jgi:hypothetical protein